LDRVVSHVRPAVAQHSRSASSASSLTAQTFVASNTGMMRKALPNLPTVALGPTEVVAPRVVARPTVNVGSAEQTWASVDDPLAAGWVNRLSGGAPVGHAALSRLASSGRELPDLPIATGRSIVLPPAELGQEAVLARWTQKKLNLPGWNADMVRVRRGGWLCGVPPVVGRWTRYEFSFEGNVSFNGHAVSGRRTAVWVLGSFGMRAVEDGYLWRVYTDGGVAVLGPEFGIVTLPAVRTFDPGIHADSVVPLRVLAASPGGVCKYEALVRTDSVKFTVHLFFSDVEPAGSVRLTVRGESLSAVTVHGLGVAAHQGCAQLVALARTLTVTVALLQARAAQRVGFTVVCDAPTVAGATASTVWQELPWV